VDAERGQRAAHLPFELVDVRRRPQPRVDDDVVGARDEGAGPDARQRPDPAFGFLEIADVERAEIDGGDRMSGKVA
jgi:hypothetical protein